MKYNLFDNLAQLGSDLNFQYIGSGVLLALALVAYIVYRVFYRPYSVEIPEMPIDRKLFRRADYNKNLEALQAIKEHHKKDIPSPPTPTRDERLIPPPAFPIGNDDLMVVYKDELVGLVSRFQITFDANTMKVLARMQRRYKAFGIDEDSVFQVVGIDSADNHVLGKKMIFIHIADHYDEQGNLMSVAPEHPAPFKDIP